jgi:hypothetical protein
MKVLSILAMRNIDSNILSDITIFNGLKKSGYHVDLALLSPPHIRDTFLNNYAKYFDNIYFTPLSSSLFKIKNEPLLQLYKLWINIIGASIIRPYKESNIYMFDDNYDAIITFCPPSLTGFFSKDILNRCKFTKAIRIQYWSDPLSLGMCNVAKVPWKRKLHYIIEKKILADAHRIVYCNPMLCKIQKELYPQFSREMYWAGVSYIEEDMEHPIDRSGKIKIGFFGAYQTHIRNIQPFLQVMTLFKNVEFYIRGDSDLRIEANKYNNLDIAYGRKPYTEIRSLEYKCDILVCLGNLNGTGIPGKIFYYAQLNKPIIYINDGYYKEILSAYISSMGRYVLCNNNVQSIKMAIISAIKQIPNFTASIPIQIQPEYVIKKILPRSLWLK